MDIISAAPGYYVLAYHRAGFVTRDPVVGWRFCSSSAKTELRKMCSMQYSGGRASLSDILRMFSDKPFRKEVTRSLHNPICRLDTQAGCDRVSRDVAGYSRTAGQDRAHSDNERRLVCAAEPGR